MSLTPPPNLSARSALLLDLDGTLIDLAATPDAVVVPPDLPGVLARLRDALGGALALVSGRPIADLDRLLPGVATAVAGEHGGAIRLSPGCTVRRAGATIPDVWRISADHAVARHPGAIAEHKPGGVTLHFRACPDAADALHGFALALIATDPRFAVLAAKMAWEIKPAGIDKGQALRTIMAAAPFAGRVPVFLGDDVTDFPAIEAARALGGEGAFVPDVFGDPARVRDWLRESLPSPSSEGRGPG